MNGQNTVVAIDPAAGTIKQTFSTGIAPRQLKFVGTRLYVSNEGGRPAVAGEATMNSYGTRFPRTPSSAPPRPARSASSTRPTPRRRFPQSTSGCTRPRCTVDGSTLYVANTNSDTVSVVDTASNKVMQTIATQPWASSQVGYEPTAITMQGDHLLISLGRANAIAVYKVNKQDPKEPASYIGLLPTDYYPGNVTAVGGQIVVTNIRGIDARGPGVTISKGPGTATATGHGTHSTTASLTKFALPER